MTAIKVCGLTRPCDIDVANKVHPEYVGFVFAQSRRKITRKQALALREQLDPTISAVGVFADEQVKRVISLVQEGVIDVIQLHGSEDKRYIETLKTLTGAPIIKAVSMRRVDDAQTWASSAADYLLLDSPSPGSGLPFDWTLVGKPDKPYFLAGGLDTGNIATALKRTHPFGVDVSSGVETQGYKDPVKIQEFVRKVRHG